MVSLKENILASDQNVPRYTSYPTAPHFKAAESEVHANKWIGNLPPKTEISLYIHLPFCPKLCWYCGCHTKITKKYKPVEDYIELLLREIDLVVARIRPDHKITHIHFGGGSPGMMEAADFSRLMRRLDEVFQISETCEIAMEIDPRNVTEAKVATYAKHGVNRISLGIQDFNDKVLNAVNRQQPFYLTYAAVKLFREYGIHKFNFDVMYGLPYQTLTTMRKTMEKVLLLRPDRISFFGYAHVPWMKKHMRLIEESALPDKNLRYDLAEEGAKMLQENGYISLGIDHYALPEDEIVLAAKSGKLHRNFQGYTDDRAETLIGLGVSSISKYGEGYTQNAPDMAHYKSAVAAGKLPVMKSYQMTKDDIVRAEVIERLMCDFEVDLSVFIEKYGLPSDYFAQALKSLCAYEEKEFVKIYKGRLVCINRNAKPMARLVCAAFDQYFRPVANQNKHATAI